MGFDLTQWRPFFALSVTKYTYITYVHTFSSLHSFTHEEEEEDREGLDDDHDQGENSSLHLHPHPIQWYAKAPYAFCAWRTNGLTDLNEELSSKEDVPTNMYVLQIDDSTFWTFFQITVTLHAFLKKDSLLLRSNGHLQHQPFSQLLTKRILTRETR